jgi:hypothetical protein
LPELVTVPLSLSVPLLKTSTVTPAPTVPPPIVTLWPPASTRMPEPLTVASTKLAELFSVRLFEGVSVRVAPDCALKKPE